MQTVLLKSNRRLIFIAVVPLLLLAVTIAILFFSASRTTSVVETPWYWGAAIVLTFIFFLFSFIIWKIVFRPRVIYQEGYLFIMINPGRPTPVPLDVVECFFLGESETNIQTAKFNNTKTQTVVVRLAEIEKDWAQRDVLSILGHWSDSYITLRGTWTEPLSVELVSRMNHQLAEIKRQQKTKSEKDDR